MSRPPRPLLLALACALALPAPRAAEPVVVGGGAEGDPLVYIYSMRELGEVQLQGTPFEALTGNFKPKDLFNPNGTDRWTDFVVLGDQRYSLRLDGRLERNGELVTELPFTVSNFTWTRLAADENGVHALRSDGLLVPDGGEPVQLPRDEFFFYDLVSSEGQLYALRADGAVFRPEDPVDPVAIFVGGNTTLKKKPGKGSFGDSHWQHLREEPGTGRLLALRGDGVIHALDTLTFDTELVVEMPFPSKASKVRSGDLYADIEVEDGQPWYVIREDGRLYSSLDTETPVTELPGKGRNRARNEYYIDIALQDGIPWALRRDGAVFAGDTGLRLLDPGDTRWLRIVATDVPPVLEGADPHDPVAAVYKTAKVIEGQAAQIAVVVNDVDRATEQLVVTADVSGLPGATFDPVTRLVSWPSPGPTGKTSFTVTVDDGSEEPFTFEYRVNVLKANTGSGNKAPTVSPYQKGRLQMLVGVENELPLLAVDKDGDTLTYEIVEGDNAFAQGATLEGNVFRWTPLLSDIGRSSASVRVSDGTKTARIKWKMDVINPLHFLDR